MKPGIWDSLFFQDEVNIWDKFLALVRMTWNYTRSVKYSGYLANHTKRTAVDLADYYNQSKFLTQDGIMAAIDLVPVLTETGGGTQMALFNVISADSTEQLSGAWRGDVLQIVEDLPANYKVINCCFAEIWSKTEYCYHVFGADKQGFVLCDSSGRRIEVTTLNLYGKRASPRYVKIVFTDGKTFFKPVKKKD